MRTQKQIDTTWRNWKIRSLRGLYAQCLNLLSEEDLKLTACSAIDSQLERMDAESETKRRERLCSP